MTVPSLPDFERTLRLSQGNLDAAELAESHGLPIGIGNDEINTGQPKMDHAVNRVAAASTQAHHLDNRHIRGFFSPVS